MGEPVPTQTADAERVRAESALKSLLTLRAMDMDGRASPTDTVTNIWPTIEKALGLVRAQVLAEAADAIKQLSKEESERVPENVRDGASWVRGFIAGNTKAIRAVRGL